jgi:hypothetical protein
MKSKGTDDKALNIFDTLEVVTQKRLTMETSPSWHWAGVELDWPALVLADFFQGRPNGEQQKNFKRPTKRSSFTLAQSLKREQTGEITLTQDQADRSCVAVEIEMASFGK